MSDLDPIALFILEARRQIGTMRWSPLVATGAGPPTLLVIGSINGTVTRTTLATGHYALSDKPSVTPAVVESTLNSPLEGQFDLVQGGELLEFANDWSVSTPGRWYDTCFAFDWRNERREVPAYANGRELTFEACLGSLSAKVLVDQTGRQAPLHLGPLSDWEPAIAGLRRYVERLQ